MFKLFSLTFVWLLLTACANLPQGNVSSFNADGSKKEIGSFHLSDPEGPQVVDEELDNIPSEVNPMVEKWVNYFQGKGRRHMERYLARSTRYEKLMKKVLRENGVPQDIFYIALIESGFSARATSHASAVGYWQFIRGTGKRYGLEINHLVDERRDPVIATQAAAEYFRGLYSVFGSWYLAMASYNVGENRVKKEVMNHYTRDFWELARKKRFPRETINYIPKYIAARMIAKDPAKYGFDGIDYLPPIEFDSIVITKPVNLRLMAEKMNYNYEDFKALNPKYKGEIAPLRKDSKIELRIPVGQRDLALAAAGESAVDKIEYIADQGDTQPYRIKRGDSLYTIAKKYRTTVAYLRDLNDIPRGKRLKVGSRLYVPDRTPVKDRVRVAKSSAPTSKEKSNQVAGGEVSSGTAKYYIVQSGDSLYTIARRYGTTIDELKRVNQITRGRLIRVGAKLKLPTEGGAGDLGESQGGINSSEKRDSGRANNRFARTRVHVVKRGENLTQIANKYSVELSDLAKRNKIRSPSLVAVGAKLIIPPSTSNN